MGIFGGFISGHHFSGATNCARSIVPLGTGRRIRACVALILLTLLLSTHTLADNGAEIYKTKGSACHGAKGAGDTMIGKNLNLRALGSVDAQRQSDDELFTIISRGKNKNRMPSFDRKLSTSRICSLESLRSNDGILF